ncbi:MAG: hypothetical protein GX558_06280 [Clostridiales bacterium]|nr:hypothetical protein [Clostridiales bacterium]
MEGVLILGLDVHGLEVAGRIQAMGERRFLGFVAEEGGPRAYGGHAAYPLAEALARYPDAGLIPLHVWRREGPEAVRWVSHVDPLCVVSAGARIDPGCVLYPHCFVGANATVGRGVLALAGCVINHDCEIGARAVLTSGVTLAGGVRVGAGAYVGQAATVRQHLRIGDRAFVGMGAVVTRDVPDGETVIGNPARPYRRRAD